jgi:queuine/archaeosine tRNA-ribosyltransferase
MKVNAYTYHREYMAELIRINHDEHLRRMRMQEVDAVQLLNKIRQRIEEDKGRYVDILC